MLRSFTKQEAFEDNFQAFCEYRVPWGNSSLRARLMRATDSPFNKWFDRMVSKIEVRDCLRELYREYQILPAPVLLILTQAIHISTTPVTRKISARERRKHIKLINATLEVVAIYQAGLALRELMGNDEALERERSTRTFLEDDLKPIIRHLKMSKDSDVAMRFAAQTLREFFQKCAIGKKYVFDEYVTRLLVHALGFNKRALRYENKNTRLAAVVRANGPSINANWLTLAEALQLQRPDPDRQRLEMEKQNLLIASYRRLAKEDDAFERKFGAKERRYEELRARGESLAPKERRELERLVLTLRTAQAERQSRPDKALKKYFELVDKQKPSVTGGEKDMPAENHLSPLSRL